MAAFIVFVAAVVAPIIRNKIINTCNKKNIDKEIKKEYTKEEAKSEIDDILVKYSPDSEVTFDVVCDDGSLQTEITESHKVDSRYDRQKICTIIERTDVTYRDAGDMSSEWLAHNIATIIPNQEIYHKSASVGLDYNKDPRWYVRCATVLLKIWGYE